MFKSPRNKTFPLGIAYGQLHSIGDHECLMTVKWSLIQPSLTLAFGDTQVSNWDILHISILLYRIVLSQPEQVSVVYVLVLYTQICLGVFPNSKIGAQDTRARWIYPIFTYLSRPRRVLLYLMGDFSNFIVC